MSVEVKTPTRSQFEHSEFPCGEKTSNFTDNVGHKNVTFSEKSQCFPNPRDYNPHKGNPSQFRKRKTSFRNETHQQFGGYRRKRAKSMPAAESNIVLPTKFLLGGNINDPLNLNSLNNEEVNAILNENTPQASPIVTPPVNQSVSVPVPCNINDPLNLDTSDDVANKRKKRNKHHKKKGDEVNSNSVQHVVKESEKRKGLLEALKIEVDDPQTSQTSTGTSQSSSAVTSQHLNELKPLEIHFSSKPKADKIVSPVIPQSSPRLKRRRRAMSMSDAKPESLHAARSILRTSLSPPKSSAFEIEDQKVTLVKHSKRHNSQKQQNYKKHPKFVYGNYNRYYGYRNPDAEKDQRMFSFKREWFEGKDVLDIGCNVGHLTLAIGKDFKPNKIIGMDIDKSLITAARKNIRHYLSSQLTGYDKFPVSSSLTYGPISAPPILDPAVGQFPQNVAFFQGNYVLESDELLELQREEYDAILALSLTKWIHLNFGDAGLKRFFKRIFKHLRPGGKLVLEPQPWSSYKKKKKLTEEIHKNFQSIQLKPAQFSDYLLSKEVGFSTCEVVDIPCHKAKGFRRPIQLYTKPDTAACSPKIDSTVSSSVVESSKSTSAIQSNKKQDFASSPKSDSDKSDKALGSLSSSNNSSSPLNTNSEEKTLETNSESKSVEQNTTDGSSEKGN